MEDFTLPVFNIEPGDVSDEDVMLQNASSEKKATQPKPLSVLHSLNARTLRTVTVEKNLQLVAEECLLKKDLQETNCTLPGNPRSTFLMAFSPDGNKIASTHGDHNINVTDLRSGKCIKSLAGHPRTPWCLAFHPHHNDILASGCLGGQVRVWDLHGGSEVWSVTLSETTSVIASLSFHPTERLLVIATNTSIYFWDWNLPQPFAKCNTASEREKLRFVRFEPTGHWLITGIANAPGSMAYANRASVNPSSTGSTFGISARVQAEQERERNLQSRYQTLLDQYERLRRRYQELRYRAAELEYHASNNNGLAESNPGPSTVQTAAESEPSGSDGSQNSSDAFWRTLMNAAENLRALSNIGRSLGAVRSPANSGEASTSRDPAPFDHDARVRIRMMSRHIESMQRICRAHLEVTQHRRQQVYRLQQIRRILEDLQEQIRYLHVCVRDSLNLMNQSRPTTSTQASTSAAGSEVPVPSTSQLPSGSQQNAQAPIPSTESTPPGPEAFSNDFLLNWPRARQHSFRRSQTADNSQTDTGEVRVGDPENGLNRSGPSSPSYSRWRRLRFSRFTHRIGGLHGNETSNPAVRRRFTRAFLDQPNPNEALLNAAQEESQRLTAGQHSLRPLMERLESQFRLQRQTMGVLSELSHSSAATGATTASSSETQAANPQSDANNNQSSPNWSGEMFQEIRDGRSREFSERSRSLSASRVSPYQRSPFRLRFAGRPAGAATSSGSASNPPSRLSSLVVSDDSSDTDNDAAAATSGDNTNDSVPGSASGAAAASAAAASSSGNSSGTVVRRMRLLWNEYLTQVILPPRVLSYNGDELNQERNQYRMWLSMMVDSLTSFFSQHGIHSEQNPAESNPPNPERPPAEQQESGPFPGWRAFPRTGGDRPPPHRWDLRRNAESQVSISAHLSISHRIQAWNFFHGDIPDISDARANIVVAESRIHNDASVDIASNGRFLAALLPSDSPMGALISLHSLEPGRLGACLAQVSVAQCVVSVSLSPTNSHLLLGLATSRGLSVGLMRDHAAPILWAQVYKIPEEQILTGIDTPMKDDGVVAARQLIHVKDIGQQGDSSPISLNCMRWIPVAGQGFALGTNKGHLKLLY